MRWMICALAVTACNSSLPAKKGAALPAAPLSMPASTRASVAATPRSVAPVTVAIVIDQFAAWVARDRLPRLPSEGGFARLRSEGTWYQDVRYAHAITDTAPGHASLYTGKVPRDHGIVTNELLVRDHTVPIVSDETTHAVSVDGVRPEFGSSLRAYNGEFVADRFKAKVPNARVYSFSLKDRGALPGGGRHADVSVWFDAKLGQFISSTAITPKLPDWVLQALGPAALK